MSNTNKPTCGVLFKEVVSKWAGAGFEKTLLFSAGHVCGQAEKVYLGACMGAMFRPSPEFYDRFMEIVTHIASVYTLRVCTLDNEVWILRDEMAENHFDVVKKSEVNSSTWHRYRGLICGVPFRELDHEFHLRQGYGVRCEPHINGDDKEVI